jgi:hypothetical protein
MAPRSGTASKVEAAHDTGLIMRKPTLTSLETSPISLHPSRLKEHIANC